MPLVYVECEYTFNKSKNYSEADGSYIFKESIGEIEVEVDISYERGSAIAKVTGARLSDEQLAELTKLQGFDGNELSPSCREAIQAGSSLALEYTKRILSTIKYHLDHNDFSEKTFSIKSEKWGLTKAELRDIPTSMAVVVSGNSICPLHQDSYLKVQASLRQRIEPLLAMRHLHRAIHESSPHHKWIDATIAAELAIKEVISRAKPDMEHLLLELPSPPLSKLYGRIMEQYLGEPSPYRRAIIKGVEVRNALIHRHDDKTVDDQEAENYVREIERAIFHLLTLLYPDDQLIKSTYARKKL